jgi:adenosine deaminase
LLLVSSVVAATLHASALPPGLAERFARVEWSAERIDALVRRMPKVETHVHLDGALSPETLVFLAREVPDSVLHGLPVEEVRRRVVVDAPRENLAAVLSAFGAVLPLLHRAPALELAAYELVAAEARQNVRYVEVRFAPALHLAPGFGLEAVLDAVLAGLERGRRDFGVGSGVIVCLLRPPAYVSLAANRRMLDLALAYRGRGVVAVDLAGNEAAEPLATYADLFRAAESAGLAATVHAGEVPGSRDLETALGFGVQRLGHATELAHRPDLLAEVIRRGLPIEVNLTSNLRTGAVASYAAHPVRDWFRAGATIALSTDDPGIFANDLAGEYEILHRELGFSAAELAAVALQGIDALFLPAAERARLRADLLAELDRILDPWTPPAPGAR